MIRCFGHLEKKIVACKWFYFADNRVKNKDREFENNNYSPEREVTDEQNDEEKVNGKKS